MIRLSYGLSINSAWHKNNNKRLDERPMLSIDCILDLLSCAAERSIFSKYNHWLEYDTYE